MSQEHEKHASQEHVKQAIQKMIQDVQRAPEQARLTYRAKTQWEEYVRCTSRVKKFEPMTVDEPPAFGGGDSAQSPVELLLTALGTCQEIMYSALASVMDIKLDEVKVDLTGHLDLHGLLGMGKDKGIPPGYIDVSFKTTLKSPESQEKLQALVDAVESQCPVLDTFQRKIDVTGTAIINGVEYTPDLESRDSSVA